MRIHKECMEKVARLCVPEYVFAAPKDSRSSTDNRDKCSDLEWSLSLAQCWARAVIQLEPDYY